MKGKRYLNHKSRDGNFKEGVLQSHFENVSGLGTQNSQPPSKRRASGASVNCSLSGLPETKSISSGESSKKRRREKDGEGLDADFKLINSESRLDSKGEVFKPLPVTPFTILLYNEDAFFSVLEFFVHPNAFRSPSVSDVGVGGGFGLRPTSGGFSGSGSSRSLLSSRRSNLKDIASLFRVSRVFREKVREEGGNEAGALY